jgi:hypothetical protein
MMNDIARQLRAQIPSSTDPDRLERMAREAETSPSSRQPRAQARTKSNPERGSAIHARMPAAKFSNA